MSAFSELTQACEWLSNHKTTHNNRHCHASDTLQPPTLIMKLSLVLTAVLVQTASAFTFVRQSSSATKLYAEGRINESIDLDSPKVATMESIEAGDKKVYCRCWQSGTFPLCDG